MLITRDPTLKAMMPWLTKNAQKDDYPKHSRAVIVDIALNQIRSYLDKISKYGLRTEEISNEINEFQEKFKRIYPEISEERFRLLVNAVVRHDTNWVEPVCEEPQQEVKKRAPMTPSDRKKFLKKFMRMRKA